MTVATDRRLTLAEYLDYDDGTATRYELVAGELISMTLGTGEQVALSELIYELFKAQIQQSGLAWTAKAMKIDGFEPSSNIWMTALNQCQMISV